MVGKWMMALAASLTLAACVEGAGQGDASGTGIGVIEWHSGGSFSGSIGGRLYAGDSLVGTSSEPFGEIRERRQQMPPGTYDRALAWLRANPIPASALRERAACLDYGSDSVTWNGLGTAGGRPLRYVASCPNDRLIALQSGLLKVISGG